jgi:VanZ like family
MDGAAEYVEWMLRTPISRAALLMAVVGGLLVGWWVADRLGWRRFGTTLAIVGLGSALVATFVSRIGYYDFHLNWRAINDCVGGITASWVDPEGVLNLLLLVPFGVGMMLATRSLSLAVTNVAVTAVGIELAQAVSGLGVCQRGDMVRNSVGGLIAVLVTFLVTRPFTHSPPVSPPGRADSVRGRAEASSTWRR